MLDQMKEIEETLYQTKNRSGQDPLNFPIRLNNKLASVGGTASGGDYRPTDQSVGVREAKEADDRAMAQNGRKLWSNQTPIGDYFHAQAYDFPAFIGSFHVLTTDGIKGRDIDAR